MVSATGTLEAKPIYEVMPQRAPSVDTNTTYAMNSDAVTHSLRDSACSAVVKTAIIVMSNISSPATQNIVAGRGIAAPVPQTTTTAPAVAHTAINPADAAIIAVARTPRPGRSSTGDSSTRIIAASIGQICSAISIVVRGSCAIGNP